MNRYLNINRLYLLIRRELTINMKTFTILALSLFGLLLIFNIIALKEDNTQAEFFKGMFGVTFIGSGLILTSLSFGELKDKASKIFYFTLPGSTLEKLTSTWFITSIIFTVAFCIWYVLWALAATTINHLLYNIDYSYFSPFNIDSLKVIANYFVVQSGFLLGAVLFPKLSFMKTGFVIAGFYIFLMLFGIFIGYLLFNGSFSNSAYIGPLIEHASNNVSASLSTFLSHTLKSIINYTYWIVLAPMFLVCAYFELKEKSV
jgi:hypothetical protein